MVITSLLGRRGRSGLWEYVADCHALCRPVKPPAKHGAAAATADVLCHGPAETPN